MVFDCHQIFCSVLIFSVSNYTTWNRSGIFFSHFRSTRALLTYNNIKHLKISIGWVKRESSTVYIWNGVIRVFVKHINSIGIYVTFITLNNFQYKNIAREIRSSFIGNCVCNKKKPCGSGKSLSLLFYGSAILLARFFWLT